MKRASRKRKAPKPIQDDVSSYLTVSISISSTSKIRLDRKLIALSQTKTEAFYARHIGCEMEVLLEKAPRGKAMHGFTRNYIRTEIAAREARQEYDNTLVKLRLTGFNHDKSALVATFAEQ